MHLSFSTVGQFLLQGLCLLLGYGVFKLLRFIYRDRMSPLRLLPGPKSSHWLFGNIIEILEADNSVEHEKWISEYGPTLRYNGFLGQNRLLTSDTRALNHVLMNAYDYPKPELSRSGLSRVLGEGLLVVEGNLHKKQRKVMNPAFAASHIRELNTIFLEQAAQLRDLWIAEIAGHQGPDPLQINVLVWLGKLTLDIIGLAGFNYRFNALNPSKTPNELNEAFNKVFNSASGIENLLRNPFRLAKMFIPVLHTILPTQEDRDANDARDRMNSIGAQLVNDAKAFWQASGASQSEDWKARDLLTLLVRANTDKELSEGQRMSDSDVLSQVPTFLTAGHETTSTAVTWTLFALTQNMEAQKKLRAELISVQNDAPTLDELNSLNYLDYVVRETLRFHAPVPGTVRVAGKDDVLPLNQPYTDRNGVVRNTIPISKGDAIFIPILLMNRDKTLWGDDAFEFRPERWEKLSDGVSAIPAVWGNILSFISGPRSCIGYRFALAEMKAILFTLVRTFEFELAVPKEEIGSKSSVVQRPVLKNNLAAGNVMPLFVKLYEP